MEKKHGDLDVISYCDVGYFDLPVKGVRYGQVTIDEDLEGEYQRFTPEEKMDDELDAFSLRHFHKETKKCFSV